MEEDHISNFLKQYIDDMNYIDKHPSRLVGLPSGLCDLDDCLAGLRKGNLILVAARPAVGKTSFALSIADYVAGHFQMKEKETNEAVLYFSLGISGVMMAQRFISRATRIPLWKLRKSYSTNPQEKEDIKDAVSILSKLPIYFDCDANDINDIKLSIDKHSKFKKIGFIVIDWLQCFGCGQVKDYTNYLYQLKELAQKLNVPILILSNLKRELEDRDNKRPLMIDISGLNGNNSIVDVIIFLYRESYYIRYDKPLRRVNESVSRYQLRLKEWNERCLAVQNICEVIIAKNKNGPIASFKAYFDEERGFFANYEKE